MRDPARFLTAQWLNLAILNFEIDPRVLAPYVPRGTQLDTWRGSTLVSLVGFEFRDARLFGVPIPFHRNFVEVNLRFYVRRRVDDHWRRGVVFVKELVPRWAVAWTARTFYGEHFSLARMRHRVDYAPQSDRAVQATSYDWSFSGRDYHLAVSTIDAACLPGKDSEAEFVVEHYWGYSGDESAGRRTLEYRVEHRAWRVAPASHAEFSGDVARLYGRPFVEALSAPPSSALLVDGSPVNVYRGRRLADEARHASDADEVRPTRYTGETASA